MKSPSLRHFGAALAVSFALPAAAQAATCEETFTKSGSIISGQKFIAMTSVPDLPPAVAINQMRAIVAKRGYDLLAVEPQSGSMLIEQAMTGKARAFPIEISATSANGAGTVQMVAKLRAGMSTKPELAKAEMCGVLAELKGGKAGRLAAASGANATTVQAAPAAMSVQAFSQQISKDAERNATAIPQRYANKRFTLDGSVDHMSTHNGKNFVSFKVLQPHEMFLKLPNMASTIADVRCVMASGTSVFTYQLKVGKSTKMTGTFDEFDSIMDIIWLKDCGPAK